MVILIVIMIIRIIFVRIMIIFIFLNDYCFEYDDYDYYGYANNDFHDN